MTWFGCTDGLGQEDLCLLGEGERGWANAYHSRFERHLFCLRMDSETNLNSTSFVILDLVFSLCGILSILFKVSVHQHT